MHDSKSKHIMRKNLMDAMIRACSVLALLNCKLQLSLLLLYLSLLRLSRPLQAKKGKKFQSKLRIGKKLPRLFMRFRYPSDADKHLLARQTGLSRNQVSNWFINARVRLWKPMVEEMYQQESKEEAEEETETSPPSNSHNNNAQTPMSKPTNSSTTTPSTTTTTTAPTAAATTATTATATASSATTFTATGKRSEINDTENDPSFFAINRQCFSENQAKHHHHSNNNNNPSSTTSTQVISIANPLATVTPPISSQSFPTNYDHSDACRRGGIVTSGNAEMGSTLIRFGTSAGDVSLTLGLRHAGNLPENSSFSVRDFGGC